MVVSETKHPLASSSSLELGASGTLHSRVAQASAMTSKLLLKRHQTVIEFAKSIQTLHHFQRNAIFTPYVPFSRLESLIHSRPYSATFQQTINPSLKESMAKPVFSSLNKAELAKFSAIAETWWDSEGPFKPLHKMNPTRLAFIRSTLCRHFGRDPYSPKPFKGLKFVDVGCGGGILSEPLARMGATVMGIDAIDKNIKIARIHVDLDPITSSLEYRCTTAENLVEEQRQFDAVIALEVIEHVADPGEFCKSLSELTVASGATVISTINRSMRAYATAILAAEYILHWLPKGTHKWSSFLTPEELVLILQRCSISVQEMGGFTYNPLTGHWSISDDIGVNFILCGTKKLALHSREDNPMTSD